MIFVALGFIILVASFLLALHSLIREQNQIKKIIAPSNGVSADFRKDEKKALVGNTSAYKKFGVSNHRDQSSPFLKIPEKDPHPLDEEVPFYWLNGQVQSDNRDDESEEAKIEKIREQLRNIRVPREINQEVVSANLNSQNKAGEASRLSGGFTMDELKKKII